MHLQLLQLLIVVFLFIVHVYPEDCVTPNEEKAKCVSLYQCPTLLDTVRGQKPDIDFVRQSQCGIWTNKTDPKVCCGSDTTFTSTINTTTISAPPEKVNKKKPLSDKRYCGYQHTDDYFYTGNATSIDEFPWLAVFIYKYDDDLDEDLSKDERMFVQYGCAGSIINARYVLTAAQCLRLRLASAVAVRLGEYNIKKVVDCVTFADLDECSTPVEDLGFEEKIIHPEYNRRLGINDIALIRLNKTVEFTDYIRPICLPIPGTEFAKPGDKLTTTGFGKVLHGGNYTVIKKRIPTQLITNEECKQVYEQFSDRSRNITENVICTKDFSNNTEFSCHGDSGAPVMISRRLQWHIEGFLVWGAQHCGSLYPRVFTKVVNYMEWIEKNVEPWGRRS